MKPHPEPGTIHAWLEGILPETLQWLRKMVEINSFTANAVGVNKLGDLTARCFSSLGFTPEFFPSTHPSHGNHLILRRPGLTTKPILLVTHLDTVFPEEEEIQNAFHWMESLPENRIYGPGTVDIKGGTMLIWMLLRGIQEFFPELWNKTSWTIAANASEETIGAEFGQLVSALHPDGAKAVLVFEGGPRRQGAYQVVTARKGRAEYRLRAEGIAAHAGSAHREGVNAIVALSRTLLFAHEMTDHDRNLTINIGSIRGGTVVNRVPHEANAELEIRAFDPAVLADACAALERLAAPMLHAPGVAAIRVECLGNSPAWPLQPATEALWRTWHDTGRALDLRVENSERGGLSDANYLWHLGPTLDGLGPSGAHAHCSERSSDGSRVPEYVEIDSFVPKTLLNLLALENLLRTGHASA